MKSDAAKGFASGLLGYAWAEGEAEKIESELSVIAEAITPLRGIDGLLLARALTEEDLREGLIGPARQGGANEATLHFLELLIQRRSVELLPQIAEIYRDELHRKMNRATARVESAVPLTDSDRERLRRGLEKLTGMEVQLDERISEEVLGGVVVRVGDLVLDGTVRNQLERIENVLSRG